MERGASMPLRMDRRQLLLTVTVSTAGLAGCSSLNPLSQSPCEAVTDFYRKMDQAEYEQAAGYIPYERSGQSKEEAADSLEAASLGVFEMGEVSVECECHEQIPQGELREDLEYNDVYVVKSVLSGSEGSSSGYDLVYKIDDDGYFVNSWVLSGPAHRLRRDRILEHTEKC